MKNTIKGKNFAIILASGAGTRFNSKKIPKHLINIMGVPTIIWTLDSVIRSNIFDLIVVVTKKKSLHLTNKKINIFFHKKKNKIFSTIGGKDRIRSFFEGLRKVINLTQIKKNDIISLIDSNRPFCSVNQLKEMNKLVKKFGCVCPARPVVNGVAEINKKKIINVPVKEKFVEFVTPEFILYNILDNSINSYKKQFKSLVEYSLNLSLKPIYINSNELNSKLTYPEDLVFLEGLVKKYKLKIPTKYL